MKSRVAALLRVAVTASLVAVIVVRVDWSGVSSALTSSTPSLLALGVAVQALGVLVSAYKWGILLRVQGTPLPFADLIRYYFIGFFANNFLPTIIGGDVARGYQVARRTGDRWGAGASVLIERLTGGVGLLVVGVWGWTAGAMRGESHSAWLPAAAGLAAGLLLPLGSMWACGLALSSPPAPWRERFRWVERLRLAYGGRSDLVLISVGLSVVFHVLMALGNWALTLAVGASARITDLAWVIPSAGLISMIPISLNGYGLREASLIFLLGHVGIPQPAAAATALLGRGILLLFSALGGLILLGGFGVVAPRRGIVSGETP